MKSRAMRIVMDDNNFELEDQTFVREFIISCKSPLFRSNIALALGGQKYHLHGIILIEYFSSETDSFLHFDLARLKSHRVY